MKYKRIDPVKEARDAQVELAKKKPDLQDECAKRGMDVNEVIEKRKKGGLAMVKVETPVSIPGVDTEVQPTAISEIETPVPEVETMEAPIEVLTSAIATFQAPIKAALPSIEVQRKNLKREEAEIAAKQAERNYWPKGEKLPTHHVKVKRQDMPCPKCRRIFMDDGNRATVCASSGDTTVFYRCRDCQHRWQMPVKEAE